ncbi:MAG: Na+/H+ antiporter NhaA [Oleiphilaceae bacterium]|nr:Na+/H+ antiporter NhaA [Oleiphilaceae bacterium]
MSQPSHNAHTSIIAEFLRMGSAGGILLFVAAVAAIGVANSPLLETYQWLRNIPVEIKIGTFEIAKPLLLWINDGLMAVFFFLVGLELKREVIEGELSKPSNVILPGIGAIGGMAVPALIYVAFNYENPNNMSGWAIPAATDIAFALGVLSLLGSRVPTSLKVFLTSLAIFDDVGAIIIIACFYTSKISVDALTVFAACIPVLYLCNRKGVESRSVYVLIGIVMWVATLKSGVHATLAGVVMALFIPMKSRTRPEFSPLKDMEHDLHASVSFLILPLFAFVNSGINLSGVGLQQVLHPVPLGIAMGLFIGKQIGIFGFCWAAIKLGWCELPKRMTWTSLYGTAAVCGIGFTMSLFISSLAFEESGVNKFFDERLGILMGSSISGIVGYLILHRHLKQNTPEEVKSDCK